MGTRRSKRLARPVALGLALLFAGGCADLTSGGAAGRTQAYMSADSGTPPAAARSGEALRDAFASAAIDADLTVGARVFLEGGPFGNVEITNGVQTLQMPAQGSTTLKIADTFVDAGLYTGVAVVFSDVEANVHSGVVVGGIPILGVARVGASAAVPVLVERAVQLQVNGDATAVVQIDLHAPVWLASATPGTNAVPTAAFTSAVQISTR
jgi:hypothetical protein